jgi:hypothetical protein
MWSEYPFFFASLTLAILLVGFLVVTGAPIRLLLVVGLINAPTGALELFFIPEYWQPTRLLPWPVGIEDFLFSGAVGIVAWILAFGHDLSELRRPHRASKTLLRFLAVLAIYVVGFALLEATGLRVMSAAVVALTVMGGALAAIRFDLFCYALRGAVLFGLFYFAFLRLSFWIWPEWIQEWNLEEMWNLAAFGVPAEEIVWAVFYGGVAPIATGYILRVIPPRQ